MSNQINKIKNIFQKKNLDPFAIFLAVFWIYPLYNLGGLAYSTYELYRLAPIVSARELLIYSGLMFIFSLFTVYGLVRIKKWTSILAFFTLVAFYLFWGIIGWKYLLVGMITLIYTLTNKKFSPQLNSKALQSRKSKS